MQWRCLDVRVRSQNKHNLGLDFGCLVELKCQSAKTMQFHDGGVCQFQDLIGQVAGVFRREMAVL